MLPPSRFASRLSLDHLSLSHQSRTSLRSLDSCSHALARLFQGSTKCRRRVPPSLRSVFAPAPPHSTRTRLSRSANAFDGQHVLPNELEGTCRPVR